MTMGTKQELFRSCLERYLTGTTKEKTRILDELAANTGMHRKAVIRALRREQCHDARLPQRRRGPKERYGPAITAALKELWEMSGELCAERLKPALPDYLHPLERDGDWCHHQETTALLQQMSLATMKRRIAGFRKARSPRGMSTTKPSHLKEMIPVRTGPWENPRPGFGEIDSVAHCGHTLLGDFAYTINYTDIATTWTECAAQLNKGQERTLKSIHAIRERLPWPLLGLDPDSGSEFVNWHCKAWCDAETIELTRSRPNHRNDNAHVEQKNYTVVRKALGYVRIEEDTAITLMNRLYAGPWRLFVNFFQPTMKCVQKERIGSKYRRRYDTPQTPYRRAMADDRILPAVKADLARLKNTLNPLALRREIDTLTDKILHLARRRERERSRERARSQFAMS